MLSAPVRRSSKTKQPASFLKHGRVTGATPRLGARQTTLSVSRVCRECGEKLEAVDATFHNCTALLEWPFAAENAGAAWAGAGMTDAACRVVRVGRAPTAASLQRLEAIWDFIGRTDLSNCLGMPSSEALASGTALAFLGLRGRHVVGALWADRLPASVHVDVVSVSPKQEGVESGGIVENYRGQPRLGIVLIWVRKSERRRGLAFALVEAARRAVSAGSPLDVTDVAFSQPTEIGFSFAMAYVTTASLGKIRAVPVFTPG